MPSRIVEEQTITVGEPTVIEVPSPCTHYGVVFEDDGITGYFYALDFTREEMPIVDALHIYNVDEVVDRQKPSVVQIVWSDDGLKSALVINCYPHAIFDFEARHGYCRTGFPPPHNEWPRNDHTWDDRAVDLFR